MNRTLTALSVPTIHLNGTSQQDLLDQLANAETAVRAAIEALCEAAPHGRDYYVQPATIPDAYTKARNEHMARLNALHSVRDELTFVWTAIDAQRKDRAR